MINKNEIKCVVLIDDNLPAGILANTATILGVTLGKKIPECVGCNVTDASGFSHAGIVTMPIPVLKSNAEALRIIREKLLKPEYADLVTVDFSDVAQCCNVYDGYINNAAITEEKDFTYLGIAIYGSKKKINRLTGCMPLLR